MTHHYIHEPVTHYFERRGLTPMETLRSLEHAALGTPEGTLGGILETPEELEAARRYLASLGYSPVDLYRMPHIVTELRGEAASAGDAAMVTSCDAWTLEDTLEARDAILEALNGALAQRYA